MKKAILLLTVCCCMAACSKSSKKAATSDKSAAPIEVLYFHSKQRCATCIAIEENTKQVIENSFTDAVKNGELEFRSIDISDPVNEAIADKYEVTWSSLFLVSHSDSTETAENLTEYAFANARTAPETFREGLTKKIEDLQKK